MFSIFNFFKSSEPEQRYEFPDEIKSTLTIITSYLKKSIIDLSLLNSLSSNLIKYSSQELFFNFFTEIKKLYQQSFNQFKVKASKKEFFFMLNISIMIYYLTLQMGSCEEYYKAFFSKEENSLWNTLLSIFKELPKITNNTDLLVIYVHILDDKKVINILNKYDIVGFVVYYSDKIKQLQIPINNYLVNNDSEVYKSVVYKVKKIAFDYDSLFGDRGLKSEEKFICKSVFIQSVIRLVLSDLIREVSDEHENFISSFIKKVIHKSHEFYIKKLGNSYHCLFRREQIYDELLKYFTFIFGNDFYLNYFYPFINSLLDIEITKDTVLDVAGKFMDFFFNFKKFFPKILIAVLHLLQESTVKHFNVEQDNFYSCFVYVFFNFLCSPKIEEVYDLKVAKNPKINLINKMIMNICYNQKFGENENNLISFNDFIPTLNNHLKKTLKDLIQSINDDDIENIIDDELIRFNIKESNQFIFAYDCTLIMRFISYKEPFSFI